MHLVEPAIVRFSFHFSSSWRVPRRAEKLQCRWARGLEEGLSRLSSYRRDGSGFQAKNWPGKRGKRNPIFRVGIDGILDIYGGEGSVCRERSEHRPRCVDTERIP